MSYSFLLANGYAPSGSAGAGGSRACGPQALSNALEKVARPHHAFLFTGTRGVGKTTIARIFR